MNNGEKLQSALAIVGVNVDFIQEVISPQIATYYFDFKNIATCTKAKLQNAIYRLSMYFHRKFSLVENCDKAHFGISMPNKQVSPLWLTKLEQPENKNAIAIGLDLANNNVELDFNKISHLLIAGTTGSGKSILLNTIMFGFYKNIGYPNFDLYIIDPKRTEFNWYNQFANVRYIEETTEAIATLCDLVNEMEYRYSQMAKGNNDFKHLFVVVDELADLMLSSRYEVEETIVRLAQKARACKIHLILATQRPTVNVITGLIKANMPNRICLKMASQVDSRTMLDHKGAEELLGRGDAIIKLDGSVNEIRFQCAMITKEQIKLNWRE